MLLKWLFQVCSAHMCTLNFVGLDIPPLQAVGWEGVFGFVILFFLQIIFYYIPAPAPFNQNARHTVEDAIDGLVQIGKYVI